MSKPQLIFVAAVGVIVLALVLVFTGIIPGLATSRTKITLSVWEVGQNSIQNSLNRLKGSFPNITFEVRKFDSRDAYEQALLEGFAIGKTPDIFMVSGENFPRFANKINPLPQANMSLPQLRSLFPQVVERAFVRNGQTYALPLSIDTLALIYNKSLLAAAGVVTPPKTWEELQIAIPLLVKKDVSSTIVIAGATLGGSEESVRHAADIVSTLMMQEGTRMVSDTGTSATFASAQGEAGLTHYAQFADASSTFFTWSDAMPLSLDVFGQEKAAMTFGYLEDVAQIQARNPYLAMDAALLPQPRALLDAGKALTYASLSGYTVSRQSPNFSAAWSVILALTTDATAAQGYLDEAHASPALLSLIASAQRDPRLNVFTRQALFATLWQKPNDTLATAAFSTMVKNVITKKQRASEALYEAQSAINRSFPTQ